MEGLVTLLEANRPTVEGVGGDSYLCYIKGRVKRDVGRVLVGDMVEFERTDPGEGRIERILPRTNQLVRPPVSNVTGLFVVFSLDHPRGSLELLDKRLVAAKLGGMQAEVILSKVDLSAESSELDRIENAYRAAGYPVWRTVATVGRGVEFLTAQSRQGIWVLTGESGVGKSTLLNAMLPRQETQTQQLGRSGRGRQTTRWVRLYPINGYWMADSPGYTALEATVAEGRVILSAFPEFQTFDCRFGDCLHGQEPGCEVTLAVARGEIAPWRHRHYRKLLSQWVKIY